MSILNTCSIQKMLSNLGHVDIISYRFSFRFTILYDICEHFSSYIYVEYESKNFEHYFSGF